MIVTIAAIRERSASDHSDLWKHYRNDRNEQRTIPGREFAKEFANFKSEDEKITSFK